MQTARLTNLQLELLKLFSIELSEKDLKEIKQLLARHFASKASKGMDELWDQNGWNEDTMEDWLKEHNRSKETK